ncbi:MAG: purine-nucleoside phosphorylase [Planctomycetota bacterium]|jgi:purine-nucleoside phosphorylase|nr:purine-nucleoside phosphorylase [Planctomycetota bacterium]
MSETLRQRIDGAVDYIKARTDIEPRLAIVLGTGLGNLASAVEDKVEIPYDEIPGFVRSTVKSHKGQVMLGRFAGVPALMLEGRFHHYEGFSLEQVTFPVRVARALGAGTLIVTNACGSLNPLHDKGDIMLIEDHINLMGVNPLVGPNDDSLGPRFPDMAEPYSKTLTDLAEGIAVENRIKVRRGVYAAMTGPCLETRAEYRMLRIMGADGVGMSTVPEVIVAVHAGFKTLGIAVLTDACLPDALKPCDIDEIIATANSAAPKLEKLILEFVRTAGAGAVI